MAFPLSWALWVPVMMDKTNPVFHGATGSFLSVLPSSAPLMVPLAVALALLAVIGGRMWRPRPPDSDLRDGG